MYRLFSIGNKFYFKKVRFLLQLATLTDCIQNRHLNIHKEAHCTVPAAALPIVERVVSGRSSLPILDRVVSGRSKKFSWFPIPVALTCRFSAKLAENPQFMATVPRTEKKFNF